MSVVCKIFGHLSVVSIFSAICLLSVKFLVVSKIAIDKIAIYMVYSVLSRLGSKKYEFISSNGLRNGRCA